MHKAVNTWKASTREVSPLSCTSAWRSHPSYRKRPGRFRVPRRGRGSALRAYFFENRSTLRCSWHGCISVLRRLTSNYVCLGNDCWRWLSYWRYHNQHQTWSFERRCGKLSLSTCLSWGRCGHSGAWWASSRILFEMVFHQRELQSWVDRWGCEGNSMLLCRVIFYRVLHLNFWDRYCTCI